MTARHTATTSAFTLDGAQAALTVARDDAERITLVDLRLGPHGSTASGLADALGSALTVALRHGAPADQLLAPRTSDPALPAPVEARAPPAPALHAALTTVLR